MESVDKAFYFDESTAKHFGAYLVIHLCDMRSRTSSLYLMELVILVEELIAKTTDFFVASNHKEQLEVVNKIDLILVSIDDRVSRMFLNKTRDFLLHFHDRKSILLGIDDRISTFLSLICDKEDTLWIATRKFYHDSGNLIFSLVSMLFYIHSTVYKHKKTKAVPNVVSFKPRLMDKLELLRLFYRNPGIFQSARLTVFNSYYKTIYHRQAAILLLNKINHVMDTHNHYQRRMSVEQISERLSHHQSLYGSEPYITPLLTLLREMVGWEQAEDILVEDDTVIKLKKNSMFS